MKKLTPVVLAFAVAACAQAPSSPKGRSAVRVDMSSLVNPIAPHDTVFMEAMTQIEIRDALKRRLKRDPERARDRHVELADGERHQQSQRQDDQHCLRSRDRLDVPEREERRRS